MVRRCSRSLATTSPSCSRRAAASRRRTRAARPLGAGERIDPNQAPEAELDRLPGIGLATARAIVEARAREGPFARPEDLLRVRGIGPATLERMRPHLAILAHVAVPVIGGVPGPPPAPAAPLDLNCATPAELERLPGIGPELARRILEARAARGSFRSPEELIEVRGIGPATLERLAPLVSTGGEKRNFYRSRPNPEAAGSTPVTALTPTLGPP